MRSWLVVLERRGVFIWPLRVVPHACATLIVGQLVDAASPDLATTVFWSILLGGFTTFVTIHIHMVGLLVLDALGESARAVIDDMRREVRELEAAQASDKRGALTMEDER